MMLKGLAVGALMALAAGSASAQTVSYAQAAGLLAQHCGSDIMKFCRGTNLGNGAIFNCLSSHASSLSAACQANHQGIRQMTEARAEAQASIGKLCDRDAREFCQGMVPGDGNLLGCLIQATKVVSQSCNAAITNAGYR